MKHRIQTTAVTAFCGKIESEIAELEDAEAKLNFWPSFGLKESGVSRMIRASYGSDGTDLVSDRRLRSEAHAWSVPSREPRP